MKIYTKNGHSEVDLKYSSGQALVLVLLTLAVVLTLVLFVLSRSITDVAVSSRQEEGVRAFSAAEAGIERALVIGTGGSSLLGDSSYSSTVTSVGEGTKVFNYPINLASGDSFTTWFSAHDTDGNLICDGTHPCFTGDKIHVCWGKVGTASGTITTPALEVSVFYLTTLGDFSTIKIARAAFDPNSGRTVSNSFDTADSGACTIDGVSYAFQKTLQFSDLGIPIGSYQNPGGLEFIRTRMFYNSDQNHPIGIDVNFAADSVLPSQGQNIESTGTAGESNRRIEVFQSWPEVPSIFEYAVFSSTGLTK